MLVSPCAGGVHTPTQEHPWVPLAPVPVVVKDPGKEPVVSSGSGSFFRSTESTLLSPERLQKPKQLELLMR